MLFEAEGDILTEDDVIVNAHGIAYDTRFLISAGSNLLHICAVCDQAESFGLISRLVSEKNLEKLYLRSNSRGINNLYVASLCWRYKTGRLLFDSPFCQKLIIRSFTTDFSTTKTLSPLDIIQMTRSVYLAQYL